MVHALRVAVVHARHGIHTAVAHVLHAQHWAWVGGRHRCLQPCRTGQGAAGEAGAVHALGEQGVGGLVTHGHQHVVGLCYGNAQFIHAHRGHRQAVGGDHRQLQPGDAEVEIGHG
ncbi:hypothetical protein D3C79_844020 [compost metagenome]